MAGEQVDAARQERIRAACEEMDAVRESLTQAEAELRGSEIWQRVNALRAREWELVRLAAGLLDEAEHAHS